MLLLMLAPFFLEKLLISVFLIVGLSVLSERVSPKLAGIITGLPTSTAIILFFVGIEIGPQFASTMAIYNIAGVAALLVFAYAYYLASKAFKRRTILLSSLVAFAAYFAAAFLFSFLPENPYLAAAIAIASAFLFIYLLRDEKEEAKATGFRAKPVELLARAAFSSVFIIAVIEAASLLGEQWSGILSNAPLTVFPVVFIVHRAHGAGMAQEIIRNLPYGLLGVVAYSLTVYFTYTSSGVVLGTFYAYAAALIVTGSSYWLLSPRSR